MCLCMLTIPATLLTGCDKVLHGESTIYASGFSERKFDQIKPGLRDSEVIVLLGSPLTQSTQEWAEVWSYYSSSSPAASRTNGVMTFDLFGPVTKLDFSETGIVIATRGDYLVGDFTGMTKDGVRAKLGEPNHQEITEFATIYHYSKPSTGGGTFRIRAIHFNAEQRVAKVSKLTHYD